jgi:hypothetical protein
MRLNAELLDTSRGLLTAPGDLYAVLNAHGLYNSMRFVMRLSPKVHRTLSDSPKGISIQVGSDWETIQAMSTYLHETIHWWQHVGTTRGFFLSLTYPVQALGNYRHLLRILREIGPKKSLRQFSERAPPDNDLGSPRRIATIVVNNQCDMEFFRILTSSPQATRHIADDPYFESVGHAFHVAYTKILETLASTFDEEFQFLPNPSGWDVQFTALRDAKVTGFYYGSDIEVPPVGVRQIFEGQARFAQLQFLHFGSGRRLNWEDARASGLLDGVYVEAFAEFLRLSELEWPPSIDHPTVALFLLVCDVACNPAEGFPMSLRTPKTFITNVDPGVRFIFLSRAIALFCRDVIGAVREYSRDEYIEVSEKLSRALKFIPPLAGCAEVTRWSREHERFRDLVAGHRTQTYGGANTPVQLLFGHHLAFAADKLARPEFFCWPGAWTAGERCTPDGGELFMRHAARFVDKADDETIFPTIPAGADEPTVFRTFENFYAHHVVYELTRQWIVAPGPFRYEYRWLQPTGTDAAIKAWTDGNFSKGYGVMPDEFELL